MRSALLIFSLLLSPFAQARVFDITKENFGSYLLFNGGPGTVNQAAFANESGSGVSFSDQYGFNYGGEFGILYATPVINFRFGLEILKPAELKDVTATKGNAALYSMNSDILGFTPKIGLEFNIKRMADYRFFFLASAGLANLIMKNDYVLTTAGKEAYGIADHSIDVRGTGTLLSASVGGEILMTDTTTFVLELGYRSLKFNSLTYSKSVETFTGNVNSGDAVVDSSGAKRSLDFSGVLGSIGFRFYL